MKGVIIVFKGRDADRAAHAFKAHLDANPRDNMEMLLEMAETMGPIDSNGSVTPLNLEIEDISWYLVRNSLKVTQWLDKNI